MSTATRKRRREQDDHDEVPSRSQKYKRKRNATENAANVVRGRQSGMLDNCIRVAELLSHAGAYDLLDAVSKIASGKHSLDSKDRKNIGVDTISLFAERLLVRGKLETCLGNSLLRNLAHAPLIPHFLKSLELAWQQPPSGPKTSLNDEQSSNHLSASVVTLPPWWATSERARWILTHIVTYYNELQTPPVSALSSDCRPARSLIGRVTDPLSKREFDVVICRDRSSSLEGVSILLTDVASDINATRNAQESSIRSSASDSRGSKRPRYKKVGYLLAKLGAEGSLALRGIHIAEHARGKGLSKLLLSTWILLCRKLRVSPSTCIMDKPLISLALQSIGFVPERKAFPVEVKLPSRNVNAAAQQSDFRTSDADVGAGEKPNMLGKSIIWSEDLPRLRSIFSKRVCKSQRIVITEKRPTYARTTYVRTCFSLPSANTPELNRIYTEIEHVFYSARLLAFISGFDKMRGALLGALSHS